MCGGAAGSFHELALDVDGETRRYFLHVPAGHDCQDAWPLVVDFHGTAVGEEPEIRYKNAELIALADAAGFVVARPRSRSSGAGESEVFRWDQNPGDLERNVAFAHALVADLAGRYHLDPARIYASGFSSGSNMVSQFLADAPAVFAGLGMVGGGTWSPPVVGDPPDRIYDATGYRDYLWPTAVELRDVLEGAGFPEAGFFLRESDMGHELYGWHLAELWAWLDRGERPAAGALAPGWRRDAGFGWTASLLEASPAGDGGLVVTGADGAIYHRGAAGVWTLGGALPGGPALAGVCLLGSGRGVAVGEQRIAWSDNDGRTWTEGTSPPGDPAWFDPTQLNAVGCGAGDAVVGGGYWAARASADGGRAWTASSILKDGFPAQIAGVAAGPSGSFLATGYPDYLGRSTDGTTFAAVTTPAWHEWWTAAAAHGTGWTVVGEGGAVLRSIDDGRTFASVVSPTVEDLYAVEFSGPQTGVAVGAHGAAILTLDGGVTWSDISTGLDGYLGDVAFVDPKTVIVVGEGGAVLVREVP